MKVKLNKTSATLYMGGKRTVRLKAAVTGSNKKVAWSSSDKKAATVNTSGKVTARKAGTATITAKVRGETAKCKVTVKEVCVAIKLDKTSLTLVAGKTAKLKQRQGYMEKQ